MPLPTETLAPDSPAVDLDDGSEPATSPEEFNAVLKDYGFGDKEKTDETPPQPPDSGAASSEDSPGDDSSAGDAAQPKADETPPKPDEGAGDPPRTWIDQDAREMGASVGFTDDQLAQFSSREEMDRHIRLFDGHYLRAAGQQQPQPPQQQQIPSQPQQPPQLQQPPQDSSASADEPAPLDPEQYDEAVIRRDQFFGQRFQSQQQQLDSIVNHLQGQQHGSEVQIFDQVVDGLGHPELFGETAALREGDPHWKNRERVFKVYEQIQNRQPTAPFVRRAFDREFWKELQQLEQDAFREKVRTQSKQGMGGQTGGDVETPTPGNWRRNLVSQFRRMETEEGEED